MNMMDKMQGLPAITDDLSSPLSSYSSSHSFPFYSSSIIMQCEQLLSTVLNKTANLNDQKLLPIYFRQLLAKQNLTFRLPKTIPECAYELTRLANNRTELNTTTTTTNRQNYDLQGHSRSLIIFVVLIAFVSLISIIGNLCLAKVLYSKRYRLIQTDRIVLCLALSELCLVLIDTPTEIYRFLSISFTQEWLCRSHTFFEGLFSSCIIFYHLLGAFDRFVYIHGHTSSNTSSWSKWCRRISTKSGSIILLLLPILCSLPIAICNCLHANISQTSLTNKICFVQYTDEILIALLISFYILPLLFSFFLHAKLIYFIRTRHSQNYLSKAAYISPMKRNNVFDAQSMISKRRHPQKQTMNFHDQQLLQPTSSHRRFVTNSKGKVASTIGSTTTTTTVAAMKSLLLNSNPNHSSNSSQSSRSSTGTASTLINSPIVLYKINSQANANANRTVLLLVLLLSFYVFCWAPYNIYTWHHAYKLTHSFSRNDKKLLNHPINNLTTLTDSNQTLTASLTNNLNADLRRIIYVNYSLYLLSMISMCFSFIFYFTLNKQARREFSRCFGCVCPSINRSRNKKEIRQFPEQERPRHVQYHARFEQKYPYDNERMKTPAGRLLSDRYNYMKRMNSPQNGASERRVLNYGCQIKCCP